MTPEISIGLVVLTVIKDWLIPIGAVVISVWFASSAKRDSDRAQNILNEIRASVEGSQRKMIESSTGILDSMPEVIAGKTALTITHAIEHCLETIRENISNPGNLPQQQHDQNMLALSAHLSMLLDRLKTTASK
jgi:hypothetical protein